MSRPNQSGIVRSAVAAMAITALWAVAPACALIAGLDDYHWRDGGGGSGGGSATSSTSASSTGGSGGSGGGSTSSSSTSASSTGGGSGGAGGGTPAVATSFALGVYHGCAALQNGELWCWGANEQGQTGLPAATVGIAGAPTKVPLSGPVKRVAAGFEHTCVVLEGGDVQCWGRNGRGQLGQPVQDVISAPTTVSGIKATDIVAGAFFTCAILDDTSVSCWGDNLHGSLGKTTPGSTPAAPFPPLSGATALTSCSGCSTVCATTQSGLTCWGSGVTTPTAVPTSNVPSAVTVSTRGNVGNQAEWIFFLDGGTLKWAGPSGGQYTTGVNSGLAGVTKLWGGDSLGILQGGVLKIAYFTDPDTLDFSPADAIPGTISDIAGSYYWGCARTDQGLFCRGVDDVGQLGDDHGATVLSPVQAQIGGATLDDLFAGNACLAGHVAGGGFRAWGTCDVLGFSTTKPGTVAVPAAVLPSDVDRVRFGPLTQDKQDNDSIVYVHGASGYSLLPASTPRLVLQPGDKDVWPCGVRDVGLLADGSITMYAASTAANDWATFAMTSPVAAGTTYPIGATGVHTTIAASPAADHVCAVTGGDLRCWGRSDHGQAGPGDGNQEVPTPTMITFPGAPPVVVAEAVVGVAHTCARTMGGDVYCWGYNGNGQAGVAGSQDLSSPAGVVTGATSLAAGFDDTCATLAAGGVVCWGENSEGEAGNGLRGRASPSHVLGLDGIIMKKVVATPTSMCALAEDGKSVYCWGFSHDNQSGDGRSFYGDGFVRVKGL